LASKSNSKSKSKSSHSTKICPVCGEPGTPKYPHLVYRYFEHAVKE